MKEYNSDIGIYGESLAKNFLRDKGYNIIEENFSCRIGEIDIIARDGNYICFIEVKSRYSINFGHPRESITLRKQKKLYRVAQYYILVNNLKNCWFRFDAVEIYLKNSSYRINLLKNII